MSNNKLNDLIDKKEIIFERGSRVINLNVRSMNMLLKNLTYSYHCYLKRPEAGQLKCKSNEYAPRESHLQPSLLLKEIQGWST